MSKKIVKIVLFLLNFSISNLYAQGDNLWFRNTTFETGLPFNKECFSIFEDNKGFIWLGSDVGLHRYDGSKFLNFIHDPKDSTSIRRGEVHSIYEDSSNNLWIGTSSGVDIFLPEKGKFVHIPMYEDLGFIDFSQPTMGFFEDDGGKLFLWSHFFVYTYDPEKKYFMRTGLGLEGRNNTSFINEDIIQIEDKLIFATNNRGVLVFDLDGNLIKSFHNNVLESNQINDLFVSSDGRIWFGTNSGVKVVYSSEELFQNGETKFRSVPGTKGIIVKSISEDKSGYIWASSDGRGLFSIHPENLNVNNIQSSTSFDGSILDDKVAFSFIDNQNNLWAFFSNLGFSVSNLNNNRIFQTYRGSNSKDKSPSGDIITAFAQDQEGVIWIGTDGDGLSRFDQNIGIFQHYKTDSSNPYSLPSNVVLDLFTDSRNQLWLGMYQGGLCKFNPSKNQFIVYGGANKTSGHLGPKNVSAITEDGHGRIYALTITDGLYILNQETEEFSQINIEAADSYSLSHNGGTCLLKSSDGDIWIGTYWGLNKLNPKTGVVHKYLNNPLDSMSISDNMIECIFEDAKGNLWIGTPNGLNLLEKKTGHFKKFWIENGLLDQHINSIVEDDKNNLWIGSNKGISKVNLNDYSVQNYDYRFNLPGNLMLPRSVLKAKNGELYFGSNKGFTFFDPNYKTNFSSFPNLYFTELKVHDNVITAGEAVNEHVILPEDISLTEKLIFNHEENNFAISFTALDYANTEKLNYYYKLEGFDQNWRPADYLIRRATYTNLDAGNYRFLVKTVSDMHDVESNPISMEIIILPPFWLRWWALASYFFVFAIIVVVFIHITKARIQLKRNLLIEKNLHEHEAEVSRIKEDFYTRITHEFRTPLTLILGPMEQILENYPSDNFLNKQVKVAKQNATRLLLLINELLDYGKVDDAEMKISASEQNIVDFFKQIAHSFDIHAQIHKIDFIVKSELPVIIVSYDKRKLERVFYNLLSNAFKYTPDHSSIECELTLVDDSKVSILIKDEGIGIPENDLNGIFKKYFSASNIGEQFSTGIGLYLTKEIVELHKGTISAWNNSLSGSSFEVLLPLSQSHFSDAESASGDLLQNIYQTGTYCEFSISTEYQNNSDEKENETGLSDAVILIIEDNSDVRSFIRNELGKKYKILEACNGQQGLEIALDRIPDLVISDIMMPELDGRSLCAKLKNDIRTSHIPIILLTALADIENRIAGLELGADSYITKPFHPKHLTVRVKKLLELRIVLQEKYLSQIDHVKSGLVYEPQEIEKISVNEHFLQRLIEVVESHMSDSNFTLDDLCDEIGMNYLQLYRKVKAISNLSLKQFILTIRMKNAAKMLDTKKFNISEVAYDVGFSSPAYFSESFKKYFKMTPTEYVQKLD